MTDGAAAVRQAILKVFTRKHSLSLTPDALSFLLSILVPLNPSPTDLSHMLETLATAYLKQDDCASIVDAHALERVYRSLEVTEHTGEGLDALDDEEAADVDPRHYLHVVDAFDMPRWHYSAEKKMFERDDTPPSIAGSAKSRSLLWRDRYNIIKQTVLRNEHFSPPAVGGRDRGEYMKITSTKNLLGRQGQRFMLFGMLSQTQDGRYALEDPDGRVPLDLSDMMPGEGIFTEGSLVLVDGTYDFDDSLTGGESSPIFRVLGLGHPPSEKRTVSRSIYGHIDFLGIGGTSLKDEAAYTRIESALDHIGFVVISDLWLDHAATIDSFRRMLEGYEAAWDTFRPLMFILCGNFSSKPVGVSPTAVREYQDNFHAFADLLASFPTLLAACTFLFVPGPHDPWSGSTSSTLPRPPIPDHFAARVKQRVPGARFASNPCRLKYFSQEIVICRDDLMSRLLRNAVRVRELAGQGAEEEGGDLKRYLVQSVMDQGHLSPLPVTTRPILWEFDHALRLYPMPTAVILADRYERYELTYEGSHVFNPGSFVSDNFSWTVYRPASGEVEVSELAPEYW